MIARRSIFKTKWNGMGRYNPDNWTVTSNLEICQQQHFNIDIDSSMPTKRYVSLLAFGSFTNWGYGVHGIIHANP